MLSKSFTRIGIRNVSDDVQLMETVSAFKVTIWATACCEKTSDAKQVRISRIFLMVLIIKQLGIVAKLKSERWTLGRWTLDRMILKK